MNCTSKPLTQKQSLSERKLNFEQKHQKPQLTARWKKVDGKLICQWIIE
ncbi:MAG: hypothetical protein QNJ53_09445 [Pleurocapsa sp. MO_192.B19]|nr:hypothetical protein [Pleurocapsa sp. MO_192.B19]